VTLEEALSTPQQNNLKKMKSHILNNKRSISSCQNFVGKTGDLLVILKLALSQYPQQNNSQKIK
jgi:hypothetical protein